METRSGPAQGHRAFLGPDDTSAGRPLATKQLPLGDAGVFQSRRGHPRMRVDLSEQRGCSYSWPCRAIPCLRWQPCPGRASQGPAGTLSPGTAGNASLGNGS